MNLKNMSLEELELLPYDEIALLILKETGKKYTTIALFKEIGSILSMSDNEIESKVTDFFTALSTNKNFILLNDGEWDLKSNHIIKVSLHNLDEEEDLEESDEFENEEEFEEGEDIEDSSLAEDEEDLDDDSDLEDLVIIDEEDLEE